MSFNQNVVFLNQQVTCKYLIIILIIKLNLMMVTMPVLFTVTKASVDLYKHNNNHMDADSMPKLQELN